MITPLAPQVIWFQPSSSYLENPKSLNVVGISETQGLLGIYYGFDEHNPKIGVYVMAWHTLAAHQSFIEHQSYTDFALRITESMSGLGESIQILLPRHSEILKALSAPITQFIYITLLPRHDRSQELIPLIERLQKEINGVQGHRGSGWGPSIDQDNLYLGILGWTCMEDRERAIEGILEPISILIRKVANVQTKYARLALLEPEDIEETEAE